MSDDAFGAEVARRLLTGGPPIPEGVKVADFGIRGIHLAYELLDGYDSAILVDATEQGGEPGTVYVMEPDLDSIETESGLAEAGIADAHGMDPAVGSGPAAIPGRRGRPPAGGRLRARDHVRTGWACPSPWPPPWTKPSRPSANSSRTEHIQLQEGDLRDDPSYGEQCCDVGGCRRCRAVAARRRPVPQDPRDVGSAQLPDPTRPFPGVDRGALEPPSHPRRGKGLEGIVEAAVTDGRLELNGDTVIRLELPVEQLKSGKAMEDKELLRRIDARKFPTIRGVPKRSRRSMPVGTGSAGISRSTASPAPSRARCRCRFPTGTHDRPGGRADL